MGDVTIDARRAVRGSLLGNSLIIAVSKLGSGYDLELATSNNANSRSNWQRRYTGTHDDRTLEFIDEIIIEPYAEEPLQLGETMATFPNKFLTHRQSLRLYRSPRAQAHALVAEVLDLKQGKQRNSYANTGNAYRDEFDELPIGPIPRFNLHVERLVRYFFNRAQAQDRRQ